MLGEHEMRARERKHATTTLCRGEEREGGDERAGGGRERERERGGEEVILRV